MNENKTFVIYDVLKLLCEAPGVAGNENGGEKSAAETALELLREYIPDADYDCHGSIVGTLSAKSDTDLAGEKATILLDAHIDQVGLVVTHISDNFVKAEPCGGIDRRCLAGQSVTVYRRNTAAVGVSPPIKGVICTLPPHVLRGKEAEKSMNADSIWIDTGFTGNKLKEIVKQGDIVTLDGGLTPLLGKRVSGVALDDRAGVCAILYALHLLKKNATSAKPLARQIAVSFSVQEEVGCRGAKVTAYNIEPEYAIAVDVSYGMSPGCPELKCGKLGDGPMIGYAPSLNRKMFEKLKLTAMEQNIPYQLEVMNRDTGGTNADSISIAKGGVKTALVSIPLRYMHTPVETADLSDIEATGKLIAAFCGA
jgi:endoglucanase